jgi:dTDP-4-amino-4,6-dideoxygalactose transaminase
VENKVIEKNGIPFLDLVTPHMELEDELIRVFKTALRSGGFIGGKMVEEFEREFALFSHTEYCIGVGSGTDALRFALIAAGVRQGDVVVTVPNTFIATVEAISQSGARPAFVDVDERTSNMNPAKLQEYLENQCTADSASGRLIEKKSGQRVTAVVPVHLYGQTADMDGIIELAERYNLLVIEDACQAHGARYQSDRQGHWQTAGSIGKAAAFSFYPGKNLGACGEAGAVTTNDEALASRIRMLRDHGQSRKYFHDIEGYNGRLDAIQAGILQVKLQQLAGYNEKRRECAQRYRELFGAYEHAITLPYEPSWAESVYHLYVVRIENRDQLQKHLSEANISTGIHYPIPLHLQKAYRTLGYSVGDFPVSERISAEILSLPMYPGLVWDQQRRVVEQVLKCISPYSTAALVGEAAAKQ